MTDDDDAIAQYEVVRYVIMAFTNHNGQLAPVDTCATCG
jgi:hypothetical protein